MDSKSEVNEISFSAVGDGISEIIGNSSNTLPDIRKAFTCALRFMVEWSDSDIILTALLAVLMTDGDQVVNERLAAVRSFLEDQRVLLHSPTTHHGTMVAMNRAEEELSLDEEAVVIGGADMLTTHVQPDDSIHCDRFSGAYIRHCQQQDNVQPATATKKLRFRGGRSSSTSSISNKKRYHCHYCHNTFSRLDALRRHSDFSCPFATRLRRDHPQQQTNNYHRFRLH